MIKFSKLSSYIRQLDKENEYLKEQLENKYEKVGTLTSELLYQENTRLFEQVKKQKEVIDKLNNYIDNYDVFKVFSFPLMKKWE